MPKTIRYVGSKANFSELSVTGNQSVWKKNQQEQRPENEAGKLIATGQFINVSKLSQGIIATKCGVPINNNTVNRQIMSRTAHIALQDITEMSTEWANWHVSANNTGELTAAGTVTLTASVEYPLGTIAGVFKWNGSISTQIAALGSAITDELTGLNIPAGAAFAIRSYLVGTSGIVFTGDGTGAHAYSCATFGVSGIPDATQVSGPVTDTQAGIGYGPVAIFAKTTSPTVALIGDSRVLGLNDTSLDFYKGRGIVERAVCKRFGYIRMAASGERLATILLASGATNYARRKSLIDRYCTHIISDYGINDLNSGGATAAQLETSVTDAISLFGKPWYQCTLSPLSTSTDSWATTANQTTNGTVNPKRVTFNADVRTGILGMAGYLETSDPVEDVRDNGKWKADGSTANLYTSDGTHETSFACRQIESNAGVINALNLIR